MVENRNCTAEPSILDLGSEVLCTANCVRGVPEQCLKSRTGTSNVFLWCYHTLCSSWCAMSIHTRGILYFPKLWDKIGGCRELQQIISSTGLRLPYDFLWEISPGPVLRIKCCCSMKTRRTANCDNGKSCRRVFVIVAVKNNVLVAHVIGPF